MRDLLQELIKTNETPYKDCVPATDRVDATILDRTKLDLTNRAAPLVGLCHEKNVSTEQPCSQTQAWFPCTHVIEGWTPHIESQTRKGKKSIERLIASYPKCIGIG